MDDTCAGHIVQPRLHTRLACNGPMTVCVAVPGHISRGNGRSFATLNTCVNGLSVAHANYKQRQSLIANFTCHWCYTRERHIQLLCISNAMLLDLESTKFRIHWLVHNICSLSLSPRFSTFPLQTNNADTPKLHLQFMWWTWQRCNVDK